MVELTCVSQAVRKENALLQRQLHIKLQIIREEYRMTTRSLEQHVRDLRKCLVYIQHTTPDLGSFRHLNTQLIQLKLALKRRAECNTLYIKHEVLPQSPLDKKQTEVRSDREERTGGNFPKQELADGCSPCTNEALGDNQDSVFTSGLVCDRFKSPKYGAAANTVQDNIWRSRVLGRFEAIFDLQAHKQQGNTYSRPKTSDSLLTNRDVTDAAKLNDDVSRPRHQNSFMSATTSGPTGLVRTRRLTWSAPFRSKQDSMEAKTRTELTNRQPVGDFGLMSATETSRVPQQTPTPIESAILSSHTPAGQHLQNKLKRPNTAPPKCPLPERVVSVSRQQIAGFLAEVHSKKAEIQAILKKSRQLQETVKMLDPDSEQTAEVGDLINAQTI